MIKNPSYKADVKMAKDKAAGFSAKGNPNSVANVNQAQGPRTGNRTDTAKRAAFVEGKQERAPLARVIEDAYAKRQHEYQDFEYTNGGSIHDNTYEATRKHTGQKKTNIVRR
jgi:hypothetical protein